MLFLAGFFFSGCRSAPPPSHAPAPLPDPKPRVVRAIPRPLAVLPWGLAVLLSGLVGTAIGRNKRRAAAGFFFGLVAGPVGWVLIAAGPDFRPRCRFCRSPVEEDAVRCPQCASDLATT